MVLFEELVTGLALGLLSEESVTGLALGPLSEAHEINVASTDSRHPQSLLVSVQAIWQNHLEERLLDQAHARASYTPLFWGHSRSIPQGMILDVQPLVKSFFCPIRRFPNGFFDSEASIPLKLDNTFLRGGVGGMGGGQKFSLRRLQAMGRHTYDTLTSGRMVMPTAAEF